MVFLQEIVRQLQRRYDVVDEVIAFVNQSLALRNSSVWQQANDSSSNSIHTCNYTTRLRRQMTDRMRYPPPGSRTKAWGEILVGNTKNYLRLSFSLDYALARGSFPEESYLNAALCAPEDNESTISPPAIGSTPPATQTFY